MIAVWARAYQAADGGESICPWFGVSRVSHLFHSFVDTPSTCLFPFGGESEQVAAVHVQQPPVTV